MKKSLVIALALVFVLGIAGTAFAANPFVDVPAKHWAYGAVDQLYKAGVVDGVSAGKYMGDKTMTRYEMAQIVAKAMVKSDKADAATKATIDKLAVEFAAELNNLGVRVAALEKKASPVKFSAQIRELYENEKIDGVTTAGNGWSHRARLIMTAPIGDELTFKGRIASNMDYGNKKPNGDPSALAAWDQYNLSGKVAGIDFVFGKQPLILGVGQEWNYQMLMGTSSNWDGIRLGFGSPDLRLNAFNVKRDGVSYYVGDLTGKIGDGSVMLNALYFKNSDMNYAGTKGYDTLTYGLRYKGIDNVYFTIETGKNKEQKDAQATVALARYGLATRAAVNSWDIFAAYIKADDKFDPIGYQGADYAGNKDTVNAMNNFKGMSIGFDYTVAKDAIWTVNFYNGEQVTDGLSKKNLTTYMLYYF